LTTKQQHHLMKKKKHIKELEKFTEYLDFRIIELERAMFAECSRVQVNTTTEHQMHKTAPNAQRNEPEDTKSR
jgi:hypothetical protein